MRIRADQWPATLEKSLPPVFIASGDEPFLIQEVCDSYRKACRAQGFTERLSYSISKGFDWRELESHTQSLSLFGEQKLIDLNWLSLPEDAGRKLLKNWAATPPEDCCLMIRSERLPASTLNTKWFSALEKSAIHVQVWPVSFKELPAWVNRRLQSVGFRPTQSAVKALCENVEGNLLAAAQEIDKLRLLVEGEELDETQVIHSVSDSSHYSVFELTGEILAQKTGHALKILQALRQEGVPPPVILWALNRDMRLLGKLKRSASDSQTILRSSGIPKPRWKDYQSKASRLDWKHLILAHHYCRGADQAIKGSTQGNPWMFLNQVCLSLCGVELSGKNQNGEPLELS